MPLRLRSEYSFGRGMASVPELVARLHRDGVPAAALTDSANLHGQPLFHRLCAGVGIRAITGVELDGTVLLARDWAGYERLCGIVTLWCGATEPLERGGRRTGPASGRSGGRSTEPERTRPNVEDVLDSGGSEGLFVLTEAPDLAERLLSRGSVPRDALRLLLVRPRSAWPEERVRNAAEALGIALVADPDPVLLDRSDHRFQRLLRAVVGGTTVDEVIARGVADPPERSLPAPAVLARRYRDVPEAVAECARVADACRLDLLAHGPWLPAPSGVSPDRGDTLLARRVESALRSARREGRCEGHAYPARVAEELEVIRARGLAGTFLVVGDILQEARMRGIPVAGRGSAVSSLVGHLLGLSPVDPVRTELPFQRFLHRERRGLPDIDIDVSSLRREELVEWAHCSLGEGRVAMAAAIHRFGRRSAWRAGLAALGAEPGVVEEVLRTLLPDEIAPDVAEGRIAGRGPEDLAPPPELLARLPHDTRAVPRLIGRPSHVAVHPGGLVVAACPIDRLMPLQLAESGRRVAQYDADALDMMGLVKIDLLGSRGLAEMEAAISMLPHSGELGGLTPRLAREGPRAIPLDDTEVFRLLDAGDTVGIGQVETPAVRAVLEQVPVRRIEDLTAVLAVVRPGAAAGRAKQRYIRGARGEETPAHGHGAVPSSVEEGLRQTHGVLLYEEHIMRVLAAATGMEVEAADVLRRELVEHGADSSALADLRAHFLERTEQNRLPSRDAAAVWDEVVGFAAYSFNKAHAASYAHLAYQSAYLRRHAPVAFACGVLEHHGGAYPLRTIAAAITRWGVGILVPDVSASGVHTLPVGVSGARDEAAWVRLGLGRIKGLSRRTVERVLRTREVEGPFRDVRDFLTRVRPSVTETESLVLLGACDGLDPLGRGVYPFAHEAFVERYRRDRAVPETAVLSGAAPPAGMSPERLARYGALVRVRYELRFLEMHPTGHPMEILRPDARALGCVTTTEARGRAGRTVRLAALIAAARRVVDARGRLLRFLTLEDEDGLLEGVVRPARLRQLDALLTTPGPYLVEGGVREERGHVSLDIRSMRPLHERHGPRAARAPWREPQS